MEALRPPQISSMDGEDPIYKTMTPKIKCLSMHLKLLLSLQ